MWFIHIQCKSINRNVYFFDICVTLLHDECISSTVTTSAPFFLANPSLQYIDTAFCNIYNVNCHRYLKTYNIYNYSYSSYEKYGYF